MRASASSPRPSPSPRMGAGRLSLEAIARRAGVSKGGFALPFPQKRCPHAGAGRASPRRRRGGDPRPPPRRLPAAECRRARLPRDLPGEMPSKACRPARAACWRHWRKIRISSTRCAASRSRRRAHAGKRVDIDISLIAFLAVEGLKALDLFEADPLTMDEREQVLHSLMRRLDGM